MLFRAPWSKSCARPFSTPLAKKQKKRLLQLESLESRKVLAAALTDSTVEYSSSRLIVRFEDQGAPTALVSTMLQNEEVLSESGNVHRYDLQSGYTMEEAVAALSAATGVIFVQPDRKFQFSMTPNDPLYSRQWDLNQSGGSVDADIDAPEAWESQRSASSILVAVIDTGIDYRHPDLAANIWTNPGEVAGNGRDDDGNGYVDDVHGYDFANNDGDPMDDNMHGTHVAGTIGAVGNNGIGVAGVAWNVKMIGLKFLDADGSGYDSDAIRALDYAVRMGAKVSNNSWGGGARNVALGDAIERARAAGHIFVAAAGNNGSDNDRSANYPSNYPSDNIIAVAATGTSDTLASWSNWGATTVDLAAPGVNILSTLPGNRYGELSGTSMAAPHVTGVVALVMSQNPTFTYRQVIDKVLTSVDRVSSLSGKVATGGRLNAAKALGGTTTQPPTQSPPIQSPPAQSTSGPYIVSAIGKVTSGYVTSVVTTFDRAIASSSVSLADVATFTSASGVDLRSKITGISVNGTQITVSFTPILENGASRIVLGPDIRDLAGNKMNQDRDSVSGEATQDQWAATFVNPTSAPITNPGTNPETNPGTKPTPLAYTSTKVAAIPDKGSVRSTIEVTSDFRIADLNVMLNLRHTYVRDLVITLTSPQGKTVTLVNRQGGGGDNFTSTLLDDEATTAISLGAAPFAGSFKPDALLSTFDNLSAKGTWTLTISDMAALDSGTLLGWSLNFTASSSTSEVQSLGVTHFPEVAASTSIGNRSDLFDAESEGAFFRSLAYRNDFVSARQPLSGALASLADRAIAEMSARASFGSRRVQMRW